MNVYGPGSVHILGKIAQAVEVMIDNAVQNEAMMNETKGRMIDILA